MPITPFTTNNNICNKSINKDDTTVLYAYRGIGQNRTTNREMSSCRYKFQYLVNFSVTQVLLPLTHTLGVIIKFHKTPSLYHMDVTVSIDTTPIEVPLCNTPCLAHTSVFSCLYTSMVIRNRTVSSYHLPLMATFLFWGNSLLTYLHSTIHLKQFLQLEPQQ